MRLITISILLVATLSTMFGQSRREVADKAFELDEYYNAIELYKKHLEKDRNPGNKGEVYYNIAECHRNLMHYKDAVDWYKKAEGAQYSQPNLYFQKGKILMGLGEYDKAKEALNEFLELQPGDKDATRLLNNIEFARGLLSDPPPLYTVTNDRTLNTEYSDYGAYYFEDQVIYTSSKMDEGDSKTYQVDGQGYSNFYTAKYDNTDKTWSIPAKVNGISSQFNDGVFTYNEKTKTAYFSQCGGEKGAFCRIMQAQYDATEKTWSDPKPIEYTGERIEMVHPTVNTAGDKLWFTSRKQDGIGGADIWLLQKSGSTWSEPIALDAVNTEYDEAYPVWYNDTTLYFSSNGHMGMGGLDMFVSIKRNGKWSKPGNLRMPFNSSADDFLPVFKGEKKEGYFSSNRGKGMGSDDVYSFYLTPVNLTLRGRVTDVDTDGNLEGVRVFLNADGGIVDSTRTDKDGNYSFVLDQNTDYKITLNLPEYFGDSRKVSTVGELYSKEFSKDNGHDFDFSLMRIPKTEITIDDIYYDYNSASLRPESMVGLNKLAKLLDDSPDVQVVINSHSDERGDNRYNLKLSEERAQSVVDYLISKGINPARLESKGWGETALLVKYAKTEEQHQQNRRTTFKVLNQ